MRRIVISIVFLVSLSCDRAEYYPDKPLPATKPRILAHAGGGDFDTANTMAACVHGLSVYDGIEVDLAMSQDGTLWLAHDNATKPCGTSGAECFHETSDARIEEINKCMGTTMSYPRLTSVFEYIAKNHPTSFISLDVKAWTPCGLGDVNITRNMNKEAQKIIDLVEKYGLQNRVMVESEVGDFLWYVKTNCTFIETYLTTFGDYELGTSRAIGAGFSGVSFKFKFTEVINKELIDMLHRKGLKIQVWTVESPDDRQEAIDVGADFIQTDDF
ncbi:MAG TPA: glycerophosphodiester phosphodiesterase [Cyclobacteriaceae bacterium]|nr:glycerophosphodiester phosphodiesterase [Cyclobacteriaceae bacterium]